MVAPVVLAGDAFFEQRLGPVMIDDANGNERVDECGPQQDLIEDVPVRVARDARVPEVRPRRPRRPVVL